MKHYQQLVEWAPDGILIHDGERILLANAAAVRLAGASRRTQLVGQPINAFLDPPYLKGVQAALTDDVIPTEPARPVREIMRRVDGSRVDVEVRAVAFMDQDRPAAHVVIRDISARLAEEETARRVEERLQQAQRMESVGALAGGVAHEFNNMMQVVLGFSDFLVRDARLPPERLADVREIIRAADRAAAVTRQLLAFSHRAIHRPQVVDLATAVRAAEPLIRRLVSDGQRLVVVADAAPHVWVDPEQLQQAVINLVLNARDAMSAGGTLTLTTAEIDVDGDTAAGDGVTIPAGRYATLGVRDTGIGMDLSTQAQIFEPFFTTKPLGEGSGLGLAAAHGIVAQNKGYITVASAPGKGTTFTLYLPVITPAEFVERRVERREEPPQIVRSTAPGGATVVVVDDESAVRELATRILERGGFRVLQASNGAAAIALLDEQGPPQVVLTDLMMPGMGGAEMARLMTERWPALPIVFMSGFSSEELRRQGAMFSDGDLVEKPFTPERLIEALTGALRRPGEEASGAPPGRAGNHLRH